LDNIKSSYDKAKTEFCLEYTHNKVKWALDFFAESWEDAEIKVENIKNSLVLLGRLEERIPYASNVEITGRGAKNED